MRRFILCILAILPLAALAGRPDVAPAAVDELMARDDAPVLIDVRTPEEYAQGHLPGAVLIPHDQLASRLDEIPRDRWVLVYCRSGKRASAAEEVLQEAGYEVRQVEGSWLRWEAEGLPVEKPGSKEDAR